MNRRIVIWGTGNESQILLAYLRRMASWHDEIIAFCDNDNSRDYYNGIKVILPDKISEIDADYIVVASMYYKIIYEQIKDSYPHLLSITVYRLVYQAIVLSEEQYYKRYRGTVKDITINSCDAIVYTAVIGGYDRLESPEFTAPNLKYICFTDDKELKSDIWDIRLVDNDMDSIYKARHIKMHPDKYVNEKKLTIWVDAKYKITGNMMEYYSKYWRGNGMLCFPHFRWESLSDELSELIRYRPKWKKEYIIQSAEYLKEGLPDDFSTYDTGCIIREPNNSIINYIMEIWWEQLLKYNNPRDQIPFRYALWKSGFEPDICDLCIEHNQYLCVARHD